MKGIFISYRREDTGPYAGRLHDMLVAHFGAPRVFLDFASIGPGQEFRKELERAVSSCECLLAVIGPRWSTIRDENGSLRLDSDGDYVRMEIAHALEKGLLVIPVLINDTQLPREESLPDCLRPLIYRNACRLTDSRFHDDAQFLLQAIKRTSVDGGSLFPLYGITLGETTTYDLSGRFKKKREWNLEGPNYNYYKYDNPRMEGIKFRYDESSQLMRSVYITKRDSFPEPWQILGFRWDNSYNEWLAVLKSLQYEIAIGEGPRTKVYRGSHFFFAEVYGRSNSSPRHFIGLNFDMSRGAITSPGTLYSVSASDSAQGPFSNSWSFIQSVRNDR
jgi:hypothetical protein